MSLNKSTGLYAIPSHHLHSAQHLPLPTFSSMDFAYDEEVGETKRGAEQLGKDGKNAAPREKTEKKKKKKKEVLAQGSSRTPAAPTPVITVTPATASTKGKKRKREGKDDVQVPQRRASFQVGADMLRDIESSVKAARKAFSSPPVTAQLDDEEPATKKKKPDKSKAKANRISTDTLDFDLMAKETRRIAKAVRKEKKVKRRSAGNEAPRPLVKDEVLRSSPPVVASQPRKTPVPIPQNAFSHAVNASKAMRVGSRDMQMPVVETPESQVSKTHTPGGLPDSPIPCKLTDAVKAKRSEEVKKVDGMSLGVGKAPPSDKSQRLKPKPDGRVSLTTSNLLKYTTTKQPLSDKAKPRPKGFSRAVSTAGSTTSGGTTPSIKELLARVGKPYSRSGAEIDPFVAPEPVKKNKATRERHEEASLDVFTTRFTAAQKAVNFSDEREYLSAFTSWRNANKARGPLPCLGIKASGCSTKKENTLRLNRADPSTAVKVAMTTEAEHATLEDAQQRAAAAESFLALAVAARVPVPIGVLEGVWNLYCPAYSATHVDKYGYGQRTLSLFSVPGSASASSYTARLSIPPRSMLFSIKPFDTPPHAGFRPTVLKTSVEGYKMEVVFLGCGYLVLRVDLRLLLSGKEGRTTEGKRVVMEFVGVHRRAVEWREREDELEVVGRRLFAKYDGKV